MCADKTLADAEGIVAGAPGRADSLEGASKTYSALAERIVGAMSDAVMHRAEAEPLLGQGSTFREDLVDLVGPSSEAVEALDELIAKLQEMADVTKAGAIAGVASAASGAQANYDQLQNWLKYAQANAGDANALQHALTQVTFMADTWGDAGAAANYANIQSLYGQQNGLVEQIAELLRQRQEADEEARRRAANDNAGGSARTGPYTQQEADFIGRLFGLGGPVTPDMLGPQSNGTNWGTYVDLARQGNYAPILQIGGDANVAYQLLKDFGFITDENAAANAIYAQTGGLPMASFADIVFGDGEATGYSGPNAPPGNTSTQSQTSLSQDIATKAQEFKESITEKGFNIDPNATQGFFDRFYRGQPNMPSLPGMPASVQDLSAVTEAFKDAIAAALGITNDMNYQDFMESMQQAAYSEMAAAEGKSTGLGGVAGTNSTGNPADAAVGLAEGGWITGGVPGRDSVWLRGMPDEFVVRAAQARRYAPLLEAINDDRPLPVGGTPLSSNADIVRELRAMRAELAALRAERADSTRVAEGQMREQTAELRSQRSRAIAGRRVS